MNKLSDLYHSKGFNTDKNTTHCYIDHIYSELLSEIQKSAKNILEIGIEQGGSILLWKEYFLNAKICGIDIKDKKNIFKESDRLEILHKDAYDKDFISSLPEKYFDLIIDDGPHTLESMISFLDGYQSKLNEKGIIVIEDVQDISWISTLIEHVHPDLTQYIFVDDLRKIKNRYDDMLFIIDKTRNNKLYKSVNLNHVYI